MTQQTPVAGLTYPEASDHTRLWEHFQTLAQDVDDYVKPFAVTDVTRGGWNGRMQLRRAGNIILCDVNISNSGGTVAWGSGNDTFMTIPDGYRPEHTMYVLLSCGNLGTTNAPPVDNIVVWVIFDNGVVRPNGQPVDLNTIRGSTAWATSEAAP